MSLQMRLRALTQNLEIIARFAENNWIPGVRYCSGCGHNNFGAEAAAVDAHLKIQTGIERLTASLGLARILEIFGRMFR